MSDAFALGPFLVPTLKAAIIGSLLLAIWLTRRIAVYTGFDPNWAGGVAETSVWLGLLGARIGFVAGNWDAYRAEPWTALYVWQPGYSISIGLLIGIVYVLWRIAQRTLAERMAYLGVFGGAFAGAAALVVGVALALQLLGDPAAVRAGTKMPNLQAQTLAGEPVEIASLRGKAAVLNFWASWCPPCRREMPLLDSISKEYAARGVSVISLNLSEPPEIVRDYIDSIGVGHPIWVDHAESAIGISPNDALIDRLNIVGLPTTFFIDAEGIIRTRYLGELSRALVQTGIDDLLEHQ